MTTYLQSSANTDEDREIARFWTDNPGSFTPPLGTATGLPAGHWMLIGSQVLRQQGARLDLAVEALARTGIALHEAFLNCWTWKYRYQLLRPITYVRPLYRPGVEHVHQHPAVPGVHLRALGRLAGRGGGADRPAR